MKNLKIAVNGTTYDVQVEETAPNPAPKVQEPFTARAAMEESIALPMPCTIVSVEMKPGQTVKKSDVWVVLEAIKIENEIMALHDAMISGVHVNKKDSVDSGTALAFLQ